MRYSNEEPSVQAESPKKPCPCSDTDGLYITSRQVSLLFSALLLLIFFIFIGGYFFGKRKALEDYSQHLDQQSLADKIYFSICSLYDTQPLQQTCTAEVLDDIDEPSLDEVAVAIDSHDSTVLHEPMAHTSDQSVSGENVHIAEQAHVTESGGSNIRCQAPQNVSKKWFARLIGYGTEGAAQKFSRRLQQQGFAVKVITRYSTTAKGRKLKWYQVVTEPFANKEELVTLVTKLKKQEKLKGEIPIVTT